MWIPVEERVARFKRYYERKNERPLLGFFFESEYPLKRYLASKSLPEGRALRPEDFPVEDYLADCDRLFEIHKKTGGDFIWSASSFWGIPWLEAALGCAIYANHSTGSIHAEAPKDFDGSVPAFRPDNPWVAKGIEFLIAIAKHSNGRYPLATPRLRGISDLLACLYGNENFIFRFFECPEAVDALAKKLTDFWIRFAQTQLDHIPPFHGGIGSFYYHLWAPAGTVWLQEDSAALLSPDLFRRHILPCVERQMEAFGGCIMHMHPTGYYPYREYLKTKMLALELHVDAGGPSARQLVTVHREILAEKPLVIWGYLSDEDLNWIFEHLPAQGLAVNLAVRDRPQIDRQE